MGYDAGLRRTAQVKAPGAEAEGLLGLFLKETERISKFGTPDHPGLKPQGAADRQRLRRITAAPCLFGQAVVDRPGGAGLHKC